MDPRDPWECDAAAAAESSTASNFCGRPVITKSLISHEIIFREKQLDDEGNDPHESKPRISEGLSSIRY